MFQPPSRAPRAAPALALAALAITFWGSCSTGGASPGASAPPASTDEHPDSESDEPAAGERRSAAEILESGYTGVDDSADVLAILERPRS